VTDDEAFLAAIRADPDDDTARLVYADWLDERGDVRGEWLRVQCELARMPQSDPRHAPLLAREGALREQVDDDWLRLVGHPRIENCVEFDFRCPKTWHALHETDDPDYRYCSECRRNVRLCHNIREASTWAYLGYCIAVSSELARHDGDLERQPMTLVVGMPAVSRPPLVPGEELPRYLETEEGLFVRLDPGADGTTVGQDH
jgi:uncharacterized protein (TIGR02996 family)